MPEPTKHDPESSRRLEEPGLGRRDPADLARLLDRWMREDQSEQRETFECLRQALDENRPIGYKLFA